jgi:hypothetical protein
MRIEQHGEWERSFSKIKVMLLNDEPIAMNEIR